MGTSKPREFIKLSKMGTSAVFPKKKILTFKKSPNSTFLMRLTLVRHGETIANVARINQGQVPGELSEVGFGQARKVAHRLRNEKYDKIFMSDLKRCIQTAKPIIGFHPNTPVFQEPKLREMGFGVLEDSPRGAIHEAAKEAGVDFVDFKPEGGESTMEMQSRVLKFIKNLTKTEKGNILCVTHGGPILSILLKLLKHKVIASKEELKELSPKNTAVSIFSITPNPGIVPITVNSISHLEKEI